MTLQDWIAQAITRLQTDEGKVEAEWILCHVLSVDRGWLWIHARDPLPQEQLQAAEALLERRRLGEPLAYVLGHWGFWDFDLHVTPAVLVPRAETELLVECVLRHLPVGSDARVLDLGTGSGAVALAIARERPRVQVCATDASEAALQVARLNAQRLHMPQVQFRCGDWFLACPNQCFNVVVANPPYIAEDDPHLEQGDLPYEPRAALVSGDRGLNAIETIVRDAPRHLVADGMLALEHGYQQAAAVRGLMEQVGFRHVRSARDLAGHERVTLGILGGMPAGLS